MRNDPNINIPLITGEMFATQNFGDFQLKQRVHGSPVMLVKEKIHYVMFLDNKL